MKRKQKFKNNDLAWEIIERNLRGFIRKSDEKEEELPASCESSMSSGEWETGGIEGERKE